MGKLLVVILVIVFATFIYFDGKEGMEWQKWSDQHCVIVREETGDFYTGGGISSSGSYQTMTLYRSGKKTYRCDDGKEYVR